MGKTRPYSTTATLYKELGWESLEDRRLLHRLTLYFKIKTNVAPEYLNQYVLLSSPVGTDRYKRSFSPSCFNGWESLDMALKDYTDFNQFKSVYLKNIRPVKKHTYTILDRYGLKLLSCLRVDFSDLRMHRFNHNFNCSDPTCKCGLEEKVLNITFCAALVLPLPALLF